MTFVECRRFTTNSLDFSRQTSEPDFIPFKPKRNKSGAKNACRLFYSRAKHICSIELSARFQKCRLEDNFVCAGIITSLIWCRCLRRYCKTINWWMWHFWPRTMRFMPIKSCCPHAVHTFRWVVSIFPVIAFVINNFHVSIKTIISAIKVAVHT